MTKSNENINNYLNDNQMVFVPKNQYLDNIITLQEASQLLGISDGYLRRLVLQGEFQDWEYKKTPKVILFYKESIDKRLSMFKK